MHIQILGPGCKKCDKLESNTRAALDELGADATVEKVTDYAAIAATGLMKAPGIMVDGELVVGGSVPKPKQIAEALRQRMG